jgi:hypothetical protein
MDINSLSLNSSSENNSHDHDHDHCNSDLQLVERCRGFTAPIEHEQVRSGQVNSEVRLRASFKNQFLASFKVLLLLLLLPLNKNEAMVSRHDPDPVRSIGPSESKAEEQRRVGGP